MPRYIFANVGRGNIFRQIRAFSVVKSIAPSYGRRGWCEIGESDGKVNEPYRMRLAFPKRKWKTYYVGTHVPITLPIWQKVTSKKIFVADGVAGAFPDKYLVEVSFMEEKVAFINGHFPPGAFNGKNDSNERARREAWDDMWDKVVDEIKRLVTGNWSVVFSADLNRQGDVPLPHPKARTMVHHKTDRIYAIPGRDMKIITGKSGKKELGIDFHQAIWADIDFRKA